jgi:hypothetical protein
MRIFHGRLRFNKETDEKFRWIKDIDGVQFKLYIANERVPDPVPSNIEVSIFSDKSLYTMVITKLGKKRVGQITDADRCYLETIGLGDAKIAVAGNGAILGAAFLSPDHEHSLTVRYNADRHDQGLKFGDPYIPRSILPAPYPERLLFLVRWLD